MTYKKIINNKITQILLLALYFTLNNIQAQAAIVNIGNTTKNTDDADIIAANSIIFTSPVGGTLNHNASSTKTIGSISTDNSGVGTITINSFDDLNVNGDIGSSSKAIDQILFLEFQNLSVTGSIYTQNGINTDADGQGDLLLFGSNSIINSNIGASGLALDLITINNSNISFVGDIFTDNFVINPNQSATFQGASNNNNNFGIVSLDTGASFTINSNLNLSTLSTTSSSTITIAAGKQLAGSGALSFNGTLNIGIARSDSSTAVVSGSSTATLADGVVINFDYSNATYLKKDDTYNFFTSTGLLTANATLLNTNLTDNSILLTPSIVKVIDTPNSLRVTQNIDTNTTSQLNAGDLTAANFLIDNATATDIDSARTALFKISTQEDLEAALGTVQVDKSNMLQKTSQDIAQSIENVTEYRMHSLNYHQFAMFGEKDIYGNDIRTKNGGLWGEVFGGTSTQDNVASIAANNSSETKGYDANFSGVSFGWDNISKGENSNSIWGSTISYAQAEAESDSLSNQKTDINSYQIALYNYNASKNGLGFFNDNLLSVGYNQYDSDRMVTIGSYQSRATADFTGLQYGARIGFGYNFQIGRSTAIFAPIAGIKYFGLQLQDYQEKNAGGFGLKVQNDYFDLTTSEIGFKMLGKIGSRIEPQINVSWLHNLNSDGAKSSSTFINGSSTQDKIQNNSVDLDADILNAGAQIKFRTSSNTSMMLRYDIQKSSNFTSHLGSARFGWAF